MCVCVCVCAYLHTHAHTHLFCSALQHTATHCPIARTRSSSSRVPAVEKHCTRHCNTPSNTLQHAAPNCRVAHACNACIGSTILTLHHIVTHCITRHSCTATHCCSVLQYTAICFYEFAMYMYTTCDTHIDVCTCHI